MIDAVSLILLCGSAFFFIAGVVGFLRFPDAMSRLHAITKADNLGLGLLVSAALFEAPSFEVGLKLVAIWLAALFSSVHVCYVLAHAAWKRGGSP